VRFACDEQLCIVCIMASGIIVTFNLTNTGRQIMWSC